LRPRVRQNIAPLKTRLAMRVDNLSPIWDYLAHHAERIARALDVVVAVPLRGGFRRRARTDST
jgi:hypothetical protein